MSRRIKSFSHFVLVSALALGCAAQNRSSADTSTEVPRDRLQIAEQMFQAHCKTAGEKIYKTVDNVDGIFLMKVRPERINYHDQYAMDDPYGRDFGGEVYIKSFLRGFFDVNYRIVSDSKAVRVGHLAYGYVEAIDPKDETRYRYTGILKDATHTQSVLMGGDGKATFTTKEFVLDRVRAEGTKLRYGVTYDDISTREDRNHWIAGSSLKVIDLQTDEVIAERIGYMMDSRQGDTSGGRAPWLLAADHACPAFATLHGFAGQPLQTEIFVEKVLKPTRGR